MRNVPFLIFYGMKISELKAPALVAKYRDYVQTVVGGGKGQVMDIAVIHEIQDDEEEENDNQ